MVSQSLYYQTVNGRGSTSAILEFSSTDFAYGNYHDGSVWVYLGPDCNGFKVVSSFPAMTYVQNSIELNGAMLNIPGDASSQGFNSYAPNFNSASSFNTSTVLTHGDCLVLSYGANALTTVRRDTFPLINSNANTPATTKRFYNVYPVQSYILEYLPIFVLNKIPTSAETIRPTAFGPKSDRIKWLAERPELTIDHSRLRDGIFDQNFTLDWPENSETADSFSEFCGDMFSFPSSRSLLPARQHPGLYLPATVSEGLSKLFDSVMNGASNPDRQDAILKMVQWGLDLWATYKNGRISSMTDYVAGQAWVDAHLYAHKALIMFAGYMIDSKEMIDPDSNLAQIYGQSYTPSAIYSGIGRFAENGLFFERATPASSSNWWGGRWARYVTDVSTVSYASANTYQYSAPMYWSSFPVSAASYAQATYGFWSDIVMRSLQGTVMFMGVIDRIKEYGKPLVGGIIQEFEHWWGSKSKHSDKLLADFDSITAPIFQQVRTSLGPVSLYCGNTRFGGRNRGGIFGPNQGLFCVPNPYAVRPSPICQIFAGFSSAYPLLPPAENYVLDIWRRFMFSESTADSRLGIKSYPGIDENVRNPRSVSGGGGILTTTDKFSNNKVKLELMDHPHPSSVSIAVMYVGEMMPQGYQINTNVLPSASPIGYVVPNSVNPFAPLSRQIALNDRGTTLIELDIPTYYSSDLIKKFPTVGIQVQYLMSDQVTWCASNALQAVFI